MPLSDVQIERYKRHLLLKPIGAPGQQRLLDAKVLCIGAGGLGAPLLLYLAGAGVGEIGIVDDDAVALSNLQRQIIYGMKDIGAPKTDAAAAALKRLNPELRVTPHHARLDAENALALIESYDIIADGSDTFATRLLVNDACYFAQKPLVSASVGQFDGQLSTYRAFENAEAGTPNPSYRCFMAHPPAEETRDCATEGIIGALAGVMGALQALEVIKEITGAGTGLVGRILIYDALDMRFRIVRLRWDPDNPLNGRNPTIRDLSVHAHA